MFGTETRGKKNVEIWENRFWPRAGSICMLEIELRLN